MRILVANDDGYEAIGIKTIANALCKAGHEVIVMAPYGNRSGFSHSLTIRKGMKFFENLEGYDEDVKVYALDGTPADCVKFATFLFKDNLPELVVSGINEGPNMGVDTMYSGTVGAAMEGANNGIKSVALSLATHVNPIYFDTVAKAFLSQFDHLVSKLDGSFIWNLNAPNIAFEKLQGIKYTSIGKIYYDDLYELNEEEGFPHYTLVGDPLKNQSNDIMTDVGAVMMDYVSITPIILDRTNYVILKEMQ